VNTAQPRGPRRKLGTSFYTQQRVSLTGAKAEAWCLLMHADASLSLSPFRGLNMRVNDVASIIYQASPPPPPTDAP